MKLQFVERKTQCPPLPPPPPPPPPQKKINKPPGAHSGKNGIRQGYEVMSNPYKLLSQGKYEIYQIISESTRDS